MSSGEDIKFTWDTGLTNDEHEIIGFIVAQWGALEAEVFMQTLESYGSQIEVTQLPRAMSNRNFSEVLALWKSRVAENATEPSRETLLAVHSKILFLKEARHSIVHGMWDFSHKEPETISTFRVKDDKIIAATFKHGALHDLGESIAELNMTLRYPGGMADFFKDQMHDGLYVNPAAVRKTKLMLKNQKDEHA